MYIDNSNITIAIGGKYSNYSPQLYCIKAWKGVVIENGSNLSLTAGESEYDGYGIGVKQASNYGTVTVDNTSVLEILTQYQAILADDTLDISGRTADYVLVNTETSAENATTWDGATDLQGTYKYLKLTAVQEYVPDEEEQADEGNTDDNTETDVVVKKKNTLYAKGKTVKYSYKKLLKKAKTYKRAKVITVKKNKGKVTYKLKKVIKKKYKKYFKVYKKTGKIKVKKGLKKGTYRVKVKVTAAGNSKYKKMTKTVTVKVIVK